MYATVVVVGAGQAGLAMSAELTSRSIDHVVLERGAVAQAWRTQRWDSLRLLTPNWMSGLPGHPYDGDDPDGFETAVETADRICRYAAAIDAPVRVGQTVLSLQAPVGAESAGLGRFEVETVEGRWTCDAVVAATGAAGAPRRPAWADALPSSIEQVAARDYRRPEQLPEGPVLVVGASSSGVQIADELARAGRPVTLSVGEHVRVPRTYRGVDIYRWLDAIGQLDERWDAADDIERVRRLPSFQLIGTPERRNVDLNALQAVGVALVGKAMALDGQRLLCSGGLVREVASADLKANRLLRRIDEHIEGDSAGPTPLDPARELEPTQLGPVPTEIDVRRLAAVVWATGYRPAFDWIDPAAFDRRGRVRHDGGVAAVPGLYLLGLPTLRRRRSTLISGAGPDAADLATHLHAGLASRC